MADIRQRREDGEVREREEARAQESHSQEEAQPEKRTRTERSDTETQAAGEEAGPSQSRYKKGDITNVYFTDSNEEDVVDYMKDHEELYNKTSEHFKDIQSKE